MQVNSSGYDPRYLFSCKLSALMRHVLGTCMDCLVPCQSMFHGLSLDQPGYRSPVTEIWRQWQQKEGIRERNMGHQWPQTGVNAAWPWNMAIQFSNLTSWGGTMCSVGKRKFFGMKSESRWSLLNKESSLYYGYHFGDEESKNQSKWLVQCQKLITRNIVCKLCVFWLEPKCFFPLYYSLLDSICNFRNKGGENAGFKC